jgi:hypothetical protein
VTPRPGEEQVRRLIEAREIEQTRRDADLVDLLMDDAHRHLISAEQLADDDPAGAWH